LKINVHLRCKIEIDMRKHFLLTISFCLLITSIISAQPPDTSGGLFETVDDVPVDSAIAALMALGAGFGVSKLYKKKK
jgi:hypothetical protein